MKELVNGKDIHHEATLSSHMPVLLEYLKIFKPRTALEFGCGLYSTPVMLRQKQLKLTSIENTSKDWYEKVLKKLTDANLNALHNFIYTEEDPMKSIDRQYYDLVFIDGDIRRYETFNEIYHKAQTIIIHDTQKLNGFVFDDPNYKVFTFRNFPVVYDVYDKTDIDKRPWTTLITKNKKVIEYFQQIKESDLYDKYTFPYGRNLEEDTLA